MVAVSAPRCSYRFLVVAERTYSHFTYLVSFQCINSILSFRVLVNRYFLCRSLSSCVCKIVGRCAWLACVCRCHCRRRQKLLDVFFGVLLVAFFGSLLAVSEGSSLVELACVFCYKVVGLAHRLALHCFSVLTVYYQQQYLSTSHLACPEGLEPPT